MNPIAVTRSSMPPFEEYVEEIRDLWESRWLSNRGQKSIDFEEGLKRYLEVPNVWLFANGHVALEVALQSLDLEGEVITTPYTHCSTVHAIVRNGLTPVFCDIRESDLTINPDLIEGIITERTCAVVATHVYGFPCDVEAIGGIAKRHGLKVVYDAAHAFGVKLNGKGIGAYGDAAMFSTHATKVFHTIEGGILSYRNARLFEKLPYLVNFGFTSHEDIGYVGTNARMNEFEAAMGVCNLRHIDGDIAKRKVIGDRYFERLSNVEGIRLPTIPAGLEWNYAYFPALFEDGINRDEMKAALEDKGIFTRKYFYPSLDMAACYMEMGSKLNLPVSRRAAASVLALPMSSELKLEDADRVCDAILHIVTK